MEKQELQTLIRMAANGWVEHTENDEKVLSSLQDQTIAWCAGYLLARGHALASGALFNLVPKERLEQLLN